MCLWDTGRNGPGASGSEGAELHCEKQVDFGVSVRQMVTEDTSLFVIIQGKQAEEKEKTKTKGRSPMNTNIYRCNPERGSTGKKEQLVQNEASGNLEAKAAEAEIVMALVKRQGCYQRVNSLSLTPLSQSLEVLPERKRSHDGDGRRKQERRNKKLR